jgi:glutamate racemase
MNSRAAAAVKATQQRRIAVLATEGTVRGGAYQREILRRMPDAKVTAIPATLFVALAEEGWTQGEVAVATARRYLAPLLADADARPDVLVLGCTHFPPLADVIQQAAGAGIRIVDSAVTTAEALDRLLATRGLAAPTGVQNSCRFLVTDGEERFARVGPLFLGRAIAAGEIERVDL